jgi:putative transposase
MVYNHLQVEVLRRPPESAHYLSGDYRQLVADLGMAQSVGRTGVCWENSVAESF